MQDSTSGAYGAGIETNSAGGDATPMRLTVALAWIAARRARDRVLGAALFANPAWDILLDLYVNHVRGRTECVSNLCAASSSPPTTALRWITVLETQDLVERLPDPGDKRRTLILFTADGLRKMEAALDASSDSDAKLGLGRLRLIK